jgi:glycogen operon protein
MYDLFSYNAEVNGCGPLNPLCCTDPTSPFCSANSGTTNNISRDWGSDADGESMKRQLMRNLFVALLTSHGSPMLLGGDEWMRTQLGNNNAYSSGADNAFNWFDWGTWEPTDFRNRMHDFVRQMIAFRKTHEYALSPSDYSSGAPLYWEDENGNQPPNWNSRHLAVHYYDDSFGPQIDILINMETGGPVTFQLPQGVNWGRVVDTQSYFDQDAYLTSNGLDLNSSPNASVANPTPITGNYAVQPRSMVILVEQP